MAFDNRCDDLARFFLMDELRAIRKWRGRTGETELLDDAKFERRVTELAQEIQDTIDGYLASFEDGVMQ